MELFGTRNLSRAFAATTKPAIGENPEGNDGENSELSLELSLFSNNMTTDEITSSFSEPILFHFFTPLENDVVITTESQRELMDAEVSLELKVGCDSYCATKKRKATENGASGIIFKRMKPADFRELKKEERRSRVSLELKLSQYDPWVIKKTIVKSDLGHLSKLLLAADGVRRHILPHWDAESIEKKNIKNGVRVPVWDCDTMSGYQLLFKRWESGSYVFIERWKEDFVKRRELKKGDEIGLYWDPGNSRFNFSLLRQGPS
jgi:hypothetical protein